MEMSSHCPHGKGVNGENPWRILPPQKGRNDETQRDTPYGKPCYREVNMRGIGIPMMVLFACFVSPVWSQSEIIVFDAACGGTGAGRGTVPRSINPSGEITGECYDSSVAVHGFVRAPDGAITIVDVPGASTANGQGTFARSINPSGEVTGFYYVASLMAPAGQTLPIGGPRGLVRDQGRNPPSIRQRLTQRRGHKPHAAKR